MLLDLKRATSVVKLVKAIFYASFRQQQKISCRPLSDPASCNDSMLAMRSVVREKRKLPNMKLLTKAD